MATITSNQFLDSAARTASETFTINGAQLTIDTDTRWHANAPASMTGAIGTTTQSATLGGKVFVEGRNVRWLPFDTGTGTVPAIGTAIIGDTSSAEGELLGVWSSLTSAPTAVGASMPSTGWIKLRSVDTAYVTESLSGIGASATGADVAGWIEVVQRQAVANTVNRLNEFEGLGEWFYLDDTNGSAGQVFQVPTNGGGSGTHVPGIFVETSPGSGTYEKYPAINSTWWTTSNLGTDERAKFCQTMGNGQVRLGSDGSSNIGYVPASGCKVRIGNILLRQCTVGSEATTQAPHATMSSRPDFAVTGGGVVTMDKVTSDWYFAFTSAFQVEITNSLVFDTITVTNCTSEAIVTNCGVGPYLGTQIAFSSANNSAGIVATNNKAFRGTAGTCTSLSASSNVTMDGHDTGCVLYTRATTTYGLLVNQGVGFDLSNISVFNSFFSFTQCSGVTGAGFDFTDRLRGETNSTTGLYMFTFLNSASDITIDGISFGMGGTVSNVNPYNGIANYASSAANIKIRNGGTKALPLSCKSGAAPGYVGVSSGTTSFMKFQRIFLEATRTGLIAGNTSDTNNTFEQLFGTVGALQLLGNNSVARGIRTASYNVAPGSGVYGTHFLDIFKSDTVGQLVFLFNEPTPETASQVTYTFGTGAGFTSTGYASMPNLADEIVFEHPEYVKGFTAFNNSAPIPSGTNTGNFTYEYELDINDGNGFGTKQTLNATNLSAETIDPDDGFKLRVTATTATANSTNALRSLGINMDTTSVAQAADLYPLDVVPSSYSLTGLVTGSEVILFNSSWNELKREVISGTSFTYNYNWQSNITNVTALVYHADYQLLRLYQSITLTDTAQSIPLFQVADEVYTGVITQTSATFNTGSKLIILDSGIDEYNVPEAYSLWKQWVRLASNAQYDFAFEIQGGAVPIPAYTDLINGWQVRPDEADHTLEVTDGILRVSGGGDPFVDTVGAFTVRINYQQPVAAISVSTSGGADYSTELNIINEGVQKASLLIPHTTDLP